MAVAWMAARWDKGGKDYINCPIDKPQYEDFVEALVDGEKMPNSRTGRRTRPISKAACRSR